MNAPGSSGWTVWKALGLIVALLGLGGFGICGLCGVALGISDAQLRETALTMGAIGIAIAAFFAWLVRLVWRAARRDRQA